MDKNTDEQFENSIEKPRKKGEWLQPYQFKKGQSGNPKGRTPGKSLKEYAKEMLASMTDEERQDFLHGIPKETIWKLAEGNPKQDTDVTSNGESIVPVLVKFIGDDRKGD